MDDLRSTFLEAHTLYANDLFRYCFVRVGDRELAKDLMQECFAKTWIHIAAGKKVANMRAFLYRVLANLIIDHYRKKKHSSLETLQEETGFEPEFDEHDRLLDQIEGKHAVVLLRKLEEPYREALVLRYIQGFELQEMADLLHESKNTLAVRVHRGLERLRELIQDHHGPSQ